MGYEEFKRMLTERLQAMFWDAVEVDIYTYYKNNETKIESLVFKEKTHANPIAVSPAVNLQDLPSCLTRLKQSPFSKYVFLTALSQIL